MALLGVQPQLVQIPPMKSRSTTATFPPNSAIRTAQVCPAGPAPIITASYFFICFDFLFIISLCFSSQY
jgi:hypothetical protein